MMGTYHPAALLRNPTNKPDSFEDMLALQAKIPRGLRAHLRRAPSCKMGGEAPFIPSPVG